MLSIYLMELSVKSPFLNGFLDLVLDVFRFEINPCKDFTHSHHFLTCDDVSQLIWNMLPDLCQNVMIFLVVGV
jgi:hypothetical protein